MCLANAPRARGSEHNQGPHNPTHPSIQQETGTNLLHVHMLGVEVPGKGLGSRLLQHIQGMAASRGAGVWLEASSPASQRMYARAGFQTVHEFRLTLEAPCLFLMAWHPS